MKHICIALDYNASSEKVAQIGHNYAKALDAKITLVHVLSDTMYYHMDFMSMDGYGETMLMRDPKIVQNIEEVALNFLQKKKEDLGNTSTIETAVLNGETADAILEFCTNKKPDLLVIGTHGHSAFENILIGNTAVKVTKHIKIPLLVVPTKTAKF